MYITYYYKFLADHIEYIKDLIGVDHVGIGSDYDGADIFPVGLENVSFYPELFAELVKRGWSDIDLQKLAGRNVIRVFHEVEKVRDSMKSIDPIEDHLDPSEQIDRKCRTTWY
ncbi:dipeptidase 2-like [Dreissena polymorpha]|uniref:dipeptidase 2-like n=1 Tax=Dreissena polymorpha TaxID=45954 RepID=UPI002264491E|nr:dipeptidase 2-like [Dreissena polymorpha]